MKSKFLNIFIFIFIFLVFSLVGCAGEMGPQGPQGEQGIQGPAGQQGPQGEQGIQGPAGQPGKDGVDGEDGHTPVITIGENGNWYIDGVDTGVSSKGESGQNGAQGPQGEPGKDGETGLSAYEIFLKYYPDYEGTEEDWITDVALGHTCRLFDLHEWNDGETILEPTYDTEGQIKYTCKKCEKNKFEVLSVIEVPNGVVYEIDGIKYVNYGAYPQNHVGDDELISELNKLTNTNSKGYYEYGGKEYAKVIANPYLHGSYTDYYGNDNYYMYSDGAMIDENVIEWFIVKPIRWRIISENSDGSYQLYSEYILDSVDYCDYRYVRLIDGSNVYTNNYKYSNIRAWLNGYNGTDYMITDYTDKGFYDKAFEDIEKEAIVTKEVDNSTSTTQSPTNKYACENTSDKIYLLSYQDIVNSNYGFIDATSRCAQVTDYAKAVGAFWVVDPEYSDNSYYWLRSPDDEYNNSPLFVYYTGNIYNVYHVHFTYNGVRVACTINLKEN